MQTVVTFSRQGIGAGARAALPITLGAAAYGVVFGVLARQAGLSLVEAALMSVFVFAGASQFVAVGLWVAPLPVGALVLTTLVINARHVLMGAALRPWLARISRRNIYASLFFMTDESWALTLGALTAGYRDGAFLLGSGLMLFGGWQTATVVGHLLGSAIGDTHALGLDFAFTAVFLALLVGMWRGRRDVLPWLVAAITAVVVARLLPGTWYVVAGGLMGSLVGMFRHAH